MSLLIYNINCIFEDGSFQKLSWFSIIATTTLYKNYQLAIPKAIRNKIADLNIEDTVIDWPISEKDEIIIKPKKSEFDDVWELLKTMIQEMQLN